jgi:hypothetical protein
VRGERKREIERELLLLPTHHPKGGRISPKRKTQVHFDYMINFDALGINSL